MQKKVKANFVITYYTELQTKDSFGNINIKFVYINFVPYQH